jgi:hypothetical protein
MGQASQTARPDSEIDSTPAEPSTGGGTEMAEAPDQQTMLRAYIQVAQRSWEDEAFKSRLAESPREALAEAGWELPAETAVEVGFFDPEEVEGEAPPVEEIAAAWKSGIESGTLRIAFPDSPPPQLETAELSDEQLQAASGGQDVPRGWFYPCAGPGSEGGTPPSISPGGLGCR